MQHSIRPGRPWLDTKGERIQAHGGSILFVDGVFYWYGENKERTAPGNGIWHWGVRCYASTDLYNWEDRGLIIPPAVDDPDHPMHPAQLADRPHIIHNARTGKYVCWVKVMQRNGEQMSSVFTADDILGPYELVRSGLRPLGMNAGDFDLVVDPSDGKAYYYFERVHSELICADLTDDYTDVTGYYSTHFPRQQPPFVREAPAYFLRNRRHHLITSGTTGYFPNQSEAAVADSYHGPWTVIGDPHPGDPTRTSFRSQLSSIFRHPLKKDLYIAIGDRWVVDPPDDLPDIPALFERVFSPGTDHSEWGTVPLPDPDTSIADYVWLPIRFDGDGVSIDWHDEWRIEDFD
ncbi:MAG: family 43 glycosylhydrolase [Leifsonia sp.]